MLTIVFRAKEKYEADLKKEIKKLQRYRDQVNPPWPASWAFVVKC